MNNQGKIKNLFIQGKTSDEIYAQIKQESNLTREDQTNALRSLINTIKKEFDKELKKEEKDDTTIIKNLEVKIKLLETENEQLKKDIDFIVRFHPFIQVIGEMETRDVAPMIDKKFLETLCNTLEEIKTRIEKI